MHLGAQPHGEVGGTEKDQEKKQRGKTKTKKRKIQEGND